MCTGRLEAGVDGNISHRSSLTSLYEEVDNPERGFRVIKLTPKISALNTKESAIISEGYTFVSCQMCFLVFPCLPRSREIYPMENF